MPFNVSPPLPRTIQSSKLGERMTFIQTAEDTDGKYLEFDHVLQPNSGWSRAHLHLIQEEVYEVQQGTAVYVINGVEKTAKAGEKVIISPKTYHVNLWNRDKGEELIIRRKTSPEGGAQLFFVTWFTLANAGLNVSHDHVMNLLQISLIGAKIPAQTYVKGTPLLVQKIVIPLLGFIARLNGYKARYPELEKDYSSK